MKRIISIGLLAVLVVGLAAWNSSASSLINLFRKTNRSVDEVIAALGPVRRPELKTLCADQGLDYPPAKATFIFLKDQKVLEVWAAGADKVWKLIAQFPVLGAGGELGPKLKEGDLQVPEGIYRLLWLNPNSRFHLSMKINYPNRFDRWMARREGRTGLGGDIFIHGSFLSIGCLAMGDKNIEKLFLFVHDVGLSRMRVIIAPRDFRTQPLFPDGKPQSPAWLPVLYQRIAGELKPYRKTR